MFDIYGKIIVNKFKIGESNDSINSYNFEISLSPDESKFVFVRDYYGKNVSTFNNFYNLISNFSIQPSINSKEYESYSNHKIAINNKGDLLVAWTHNFAQKANVEYQIFSVDGQPISRLEAVNQMNEVNIEPEQILFDENNNIAINWYSTSFMQNEKLNFKIIGTNDKNTIILNKNKTLDISELPGFNEKIKNDEHYVVFNDQSKAEVKGNKITGKKVGSLKVDIVSKTTPSNFISQEILIREEKY